MSIDGPFARSSLSLSLLPYLVSAAPGFEMTVTDAFGVAGGKTVVAGVVKSGEVSVGDSVCLRSGAGPFSVDGIESFNKVLEKAASGDRVGIVLSGIEAEEIELGIDLIHCGDGSENRGANSDER